MRRADPAQIDTIVRVAACVSGHESAKRRARVTESVWCRGVPYETWTWPPLSLSTQKARAQRSFGPFQGYDCRASPLTRESMEASVRQLSESRIREILVGMPAFHEQVGELSHTMGAQTLVALPSDENHPPASSLVDVVAPYFSDELPEVEFYQDVIRLKELWTYVSMPGAARPRIDAAIANLRLQTAQVMTNVPNPEMAVLFETMISSRIAQLESVTEEELSAIKRLAPEIEKELFHRAQPATVGRPARSERAGVNSK